MPFKIVAQHRKEPVVFSDSYSGWEYGFLLGILLNLLFWFPRRYLKNSNFFDVVQIEPVVILWKDLLEVDSWPKFEKKNPRRTRDTADCFFPKLTYLLGNQKRRFAIIEQNFERLYLWFWLLSPSQTLVASQHRRAAFIELQAGWFGLLGQNSIFQAVFTHLNTGEALCFDSFYTRSCRPPSLFVDQSIGWALVKHRNSDSNLSQSIYACPATQEQDRHILIYSEILRLSLWCLEAMRQNWPVRWARLTCSRAKAMPNFVLASVATRMGCKQAKFGWDCARTVGSVPLSLDSAFSDNQKLQVFFGNFPYKFVIFAQLCTLAVSMWRLQPPRPCRCLQLGCCSFNRMLNIDWNASFACVAS